MTLHEAVRALFKLLDMVEESDSGRVFHPVFISTCRAMEIDKLNFILNELRREVGLSNEYSNAGRRNDDFVKGESI